MEEEDVEEEEVEEVVEEDVEDEDKSEAEVVDDDDEDGSEETIVLSWSRCCRMVSAESRGLGYWATIWKNSKSDFSRESKSH